MYISHLKVINSFTCHNRFRLASTLAYRGPSNHWRHRWRYLGGLAAGGLVAFTTYSWLNPSKRLLESTHYTPTRLTSSEHSSQDESHKLIELTVPKGHLPISLPAPIWSIFVKDHDIQIERPFTPLEGIDPSGRVRFWVKRYETGEMGRWLCAQRVGDLIDIRGPVQTLDWARERTKWDHVLMISGGTGITPFVQLLHHVFNEDPAPNCQFTLLHSSPTPVQLPPLDILNRLSEQAKLSQIQFNMHLFVDSAEAAHSPPIAVNERRIGLTDIQKALVEWEATGKEQQRILVLVCGPPPMIAAIAGPRISEVEEGRVSGILGTLGFDHRNVRKL